MKKDYATIFVKKTLKALNIRIDKNSENLIIQIFKFIIVGGIAFIIDFICLFIFKEVFNLKIIIANTLAFSLSTIYNYIASIKWVFNVKKESDKKRQCITFIIFSIFGLLLNDLIMLVGTNILSIYYLLSKIIATGIVLVFNFITRKIFLEK